MYNYITLNMFFIQLYFFMPQFIQICTQLDYMHAERGDYSYTYSYTFLHVIRVSLCFHCDLICKSAGKPAFHDLNLEDVSCIFSFFWSCSLFLLSLSSLFRVKVNPNWMKDFCSWHNFSNLNCHRRLKWQEDPISEPQHLKTSFASVCWYLAHPAPLSIALSFFSVSSSLVLSWVSFDGQVLSETVN